MVTKLAWILTTTIEHSNIVNRDQRLNTRNMGVLHEISCITWHQSFPIHDVEDGEIVDLKMKSTSTNWRVKHSHRKMILLVNISHEYGCWHLLYRATRFVGYINIHTYIPLNLKDSYGAISGDASRKSGSFMSHRGFRLGFLSLPKLDHVILVRLSRRRMLHYDTWKV